MLYMASDLQEEIDVDVNKKKKKKAHALEALEFATSREILRIKESRNSFPFSCQIASIFGMQ